MPEPPQPNLPAVRPARPPYIEAFEKFTQGKNDQIEALVAYGLFISSEYRWASHQPAWPTEEMIRSSYGRLLDDDEFQKTEGAARRIVDEHREKLVREHQKKYLDDLFKDIKQHADNIFTGIERRADELSKSHKHFSKGVAEAATGAFVWTLILILLALCLYWAGIDLFHIVEKMPHA